MGSRFLNKYLVVSGGHTLDGVMHQASCSGCGPARARQVYVSQHRGRWEEFSCTTLGTIWPTTNSNCKHWLPGRPAQCDAAFV